jgi:hydroxylamine reductase
MSMFCFQCQETAKGTGCEVRGVCGKTEDVAKLQDLLIYTLKGIALGPTLPGFISPNVAKVLIENFGIAGIGTVEDDIKLFMEA